MEVMLIRLQLPAPHQHRGAIATVKTKTAVRKSDCGEKEKKSPNRQFRSQYTKLYIRIHRQLPDAFGKLGKPLREGSNQAIARPRIRILIIGA